MKISVVIPCRNEKRHIGEFLDSLLMQELDRVWQVEILVADGLSDDGTREVLRQYSQDAPQVRMIDNPGRIVSTGLNAAIGAATGEIIIRMDAHTVYARDYIRECVRVLRGDILFRQQMCLIPAKLFRSEFVRKVLGEPVHCQHANSRAVVDEVSI